MTEEDLPAARERLNAELERIKARYMEHRAAGEPTDAEERAAREAVELFNAEMRKIEQHYVQKSQELQRDMLRFLVLYVAALACWLVNLWTVKAPEVNFLFQVFNLGWVIKGAIDMHILNKRNRK